MRSWVNIFLFVSTVVVYSGCSTKTTPTATISAAKSLPDGWRKSIPLPQVVDEAGNVLIQKATIEAWVEQGWLVVRRLSEAGNTQWQCVLASDDAGEDVRANVDEHLASFKLEFGKFFISETLGDIRIVRQLKQGNDRWPTYSLAKDKLLASGTMISKGITVAGHEVDDWCWVTSGLANGDRNDLWLRLEHIDLFGNGCGGTGKYKPAEFFYGDRRAKDDGDMFTANRSTDEWVAALLQKKQTRELMKNGTLPELSYDETFNVSSSLDLSKLRGTPVLLDFWGTWCGPCVKNLPKVQALHKEFADKGLVVIGVHSKQASETVADYLAKSDITFPIVVDTGETAKAFGIEAFPTYFLIDRQGKVVEGFANHPPTDEAIRKLLN